MLRKFCFATLSICFAGAASAQDLSYSGSGYQGGGTTITEGSGSYQDTSQLFLDDELANLPSDLTHERWGKRHQPFFKKYDVDRDGVWSELDLVGIDEDYVKRWATNTVVDTFSFWHPNRIAHANQITAELQVISQRNDFLAATADAASSARGALTDIGLMGDKDAPMYIEANPDGDAQIVRRGSVAEKSRSWVEVSVPISLKMTSGTNVSEAQYVAHIIAMTRFPVYDGDDTWALWNLSISGK
ncbi:hypothetical protein [Sulfitobacter sp. R18_1]|uniref:hypothetical protein n=1 Tax=Sulfitobacter sp. R18_1 TaxID=2821104 RepID=UPI001AD98370|nr:hypothetical protein [Sulfitobacter sp. R18_1]MBO9428376.1 hypothetical protein [Sulfitobacter sp. R18_1]